MEKLLELIIEFQKGIGQVTYDLDMYHYDDKLKLIIIGSDVSKGFIDYIDIFRLIFAPGFIQWLVENEKIEYRKIIEKEIEVGFKLVRIKDYPNKIMKEDVEELLMLLSVQDNPIEFLISILKDKKVRTVYVDEDGNVSGDTKRYSDC